MSDNALRRLVVLGEALCDLLPPAPGVALEAAATLTPALGGAPANVAVQIARLGLPSSLITAVGDEPLSARTLAGLRAEGVDTSAIIVRERGRLGLTLVAVDTDGERAFFPWREGAADQTLREDEIDTALIAGARCLVRGTVSMRSAAVRGATRRAVAVARDHGVPVVLDVNLRRKMFDVQAELHALALESVRSSTVVKATREEAAALFETNASKTAPLDDDTLMSRLLDEGPELVLLTLGDEGARAATRRARAFVAAPEVKVVDATGAGDAFVGATTAALFGHDHPPALAEFDEGALVALLRLANAAGAAACTALGATTGLLDGNQLPLPELPRSPS